MADAATWHRRVADWRASKETAAAFCERRGYGLSALRYWARRKPAPPSIRLARVERVSAAPAPMPPLPGVIIELGGARVLVEFGVDVATLTTVLTALRGGIR